MVVPSRSLLDGVDLFVGEPADDDDDACPKSERDDVDCGKMADNSGEIGRASSDTDELASSVVDDGGSSKMEC